MSDENAPIRLTHYRLAVKRRFWPGQKVFEIYRHDLVTETGHLTLYLTNNEIISLPIAARSWRVYPEYWDFMRQFEQRQEQADASPLWS